MVGFVFDLDGVVYEFDDVVVDGEVKVGVVVDMCG